MDLSGGVTYLHRRRRMRAGPSSVVRGERVSSSKRWRISSARETTGARVRMWYVWTQARWSRSVRSKLHCGRRTQQQHCGDGGRRVAGQVARGAPGTETQPTNPDARTARRVLPSAPISAPISRLICVGYVTAAPLGARVHRFPTTHSDHPIVYPPSPTIILCDAAGRVERQRWSWCCDGGGGGATVDCWLCVVFSLLSPPSTRRFIYYYYYFLKLFLPCCGCRARRVCVPPPPSNIDFEKKRARASHTRAVYIIL